MLLYGLFVYVSICIRVRVSRDTVNAFKRTSLRSSPRLCDMNQPAPIEHRSLFMLHRGSVDMPDALRALSNTL